MLTSFKYNFNTNNTIFVILVQKTIDTNGNLSYTFRINVIRIFFVGKG